MKLEIPAYNPEKYDPKEFVNDNLSDKLFECFKSSNPLDQINAMNALLKQSGGDNV